AGGGGQHPPTHPNGSGGFPVWIQSVERAGDAGGKRGASFPPFGVGGLSLPYRVANFRNRRIRVGDREVGGFGEGGAGTSRLLSARPQCGRRGWRPLRGGGSAHLAGGICGSGIRRGPAEF